MKRRRKYGNLIPIIGTTLVLLVIFLSVVMFMFLNNIPLSALSKNFGNAYSSNMRHSNEKRTLTIFTTVMEADDDPLRYLAQENCLSLLAELPSTYVIIFTDSSTWIRKARSMNIHYMKSIESNQFGTPYLKAMFLYAMKNFNSDFYGYVNADILLDSTLIESLQQIQKDVNNKQISDRLYIVGQRTNVQQELEDRFVRGGEESAVEFVTRILLKGHRYWDSAVDYHIVSRNAFDWNEMPNFVIGRSGYDLYLVQTAYLDGIIKMIDVTNTVHCAHMLSKDGNRSGIKRKTPDNNWNKKILNELPGGCCSFSSFSKLADRHTVKLDESICLATHGFEGYYDDSYYDTEKEFIRKAMNSKVAEECLLVSENDVLGLLLPYCKALTVIILNNEACERTLQRFQNCGVDVQLGCNRNKMSPRDVVFTMFQKIDTLFDLVIIQSEKPIAMIQWVENRLSMNGVLIMRRWLDPTERKEIEKVLHGSFVPLGTVEAPPEFDKTHDEHFGMAGFQKTQ